MSIAGLPRNGVAYDYKRCKHLVCFGRNIFESLGTGEAKQVIDMLERGSRFDFFDVRWNFTAAKSTSFHVVRPGSDYAIVLALLHTVIEEKLFDASFVDRWVNGLAELTDFLRPHTPAEAERLSGVPAEKIVRLARQLGEAAPAVIVHPGWMTAWRADDFYLRRGDLRAQCTARYLRSKGRLGPGQEPRRRGGEAAAAHRVRSCSGVDTALRRCGRG